jgi:hypothetical protein
MQTDAHTRRDVLLLTEYVVRTKRPTQAAEPAVWLIMSVWDGYGCLDQPLEKLFVASTMQGCVQHA